MATEIYTGTATVGATEFSLTAGSTTLQTKTDNGVMQLMIDFSAMTATETYQIAYYETVKAAGTKRLIHRETIIGVFGSPNYCGPAMALLNGWDMTLTKLLGTDRSVDWSIRKA